MDTNFLYEFSERQEALREAQTYQTDSTKIAADASKKASARIRSLPVKTRFDILVREYPGEFRLCSEDTCSESIVPDTCRTIVDNDDGSTTVIEFVGHSHEHECVKHKVEDCSWIHPIEIKRSSMIEDDEHLQDESAGGDYVRDWDELYLDFPLGEEDEWSKFTYAKSRTVTRQSNPRKVMKEEFTLKETLPNNAYGGVYGAEDGVDYSLSTATAKTFSRVCPHYSTPRKVVKRSGFSGLTLGQMRQVMIDTVGIDPLKKG